MKSLFVVNRLVGTQPYHPDDNLPAEDNIRARVFNWDGLKEVTGRENTTRALYLFSLCISDLNCDGLFFCAAMAFIARLVASVPAERMSLTEALWHDWLLKLTEDMDRVTIKDKKEDEDAGETALALGRGGGSEEANECLTGRSDDVDVDGGMR